MAAIRTDTSFDEAATAFADSALGGHLPMDVASLITQAGVLRHRPELALPLLERARAMAPAHPAPLIALYRFHFYGHALDKARAVGEEALTVARAALGPGFDHAPPPENAVRHDAAVRFYLFTLKGLAYLNLRLNAFDEARRRLDELRRLDPRDHTGGALLAHVLTRHTQPPAPEEDELHAHPVRGWSPAT